MKRVVDEALDNLAAVRMSPRIRELEAEVKRLREVVRAAEYCIRYHCGHSGPCDCDEADMVRAALQGGGK